MTTPLKTFHARLVDDYDEYPEAFCAIHEYSVTSQKTNKSEDCAADYTESGSDIQAAAYKVNFWHSSNAKGTGKRSRPLMHMVDGVLTDVFTVDVDHEEAQQIIASDLQGKEKELHLMRRDLTRLFQ